MFEGVTGFMKGIWGRPAKKATGLVGIWGTITHASDHIFDAILSPFKIIKYIVVIIIGVILYMRFKK